MVHRAGTPPSKKDGSVAQQTRLHKRGNVYYFRARIPLNIQHLYAPQTEIKFSLRTSSLKEAKALVNQFSVKYDAEFDLKQQALDSQDALPTVLRIVDEATAKAIGRLWVRQVVDGDEHIRQHGQRRRVRRPRSRAGHLRAVHAPGPRPRQGRHRRARHDAVPRAQGHSARLRCRRPSTALQTLPQCLHRRLAAPAAAQPGRNRHRRRDRPRCQHLPGDCSAARAAHPGRTIHRLARCRSRPQYQLGGRRSRLRPRIRPLHEVKGATQLHARRLQRLQETPGRARQQPPDRRQENRLPVQPS